MTFNLICINTDFQFLQNKNKTIEFQSYLFVNPRSRDGVGIVRFGVRIDPDTIMAYGKRDEPAFWVGLGFPAAIACSV